MRYSLILFVFLSIQAYAYQDFSIQCGFNGDLEINYKSGDLLIKGQKTGLHIQERFGTHTIYFRAEIKSAYCQNHYKNLFVKKCKSNKRTSLKLEVSDVEGNVLESSDFKLGAFYHFESAYQNLETIDGSTSVLGASKGYNFYFDTWMAWRLSYKFHELECRYN